jgi:hypothetical protein
VIASKNQLVEIFQRLHKAEAIIMNYFIVVLLFLVENPLAAPFQPECRQENQERKRSRS